MRKKRFTKIICTTIAAISAVTLAIAPACTNKWKGVSEKETADSLAKVSSNGGFLVETGDYVYFINGKASNTDTNNFGSVLKGSVQRIAKSDLDDGNYANSQTVVPSVIYSGNYNAGIYIYGDYIYYTTPSTEKKTSGEVLNSNLDFKRTKVDGTDTTKNYIWQSSDNAVDYRYVQQGDTVYIIYALSENLYGESATNIHSVNCSTGANTILAYKVTDYAFDTEDPTNPYVYYTMDVPQYFGGSNYGYNQLYRVRADVTESPRTYDFTGVDGYDASSNPVYINMGDYVFDGIGKINNETENRITQLNYAHYHTDKTYNLINDDYTYDIKWYKDGTLYYARKSKGGTNALYTLTNEEYDAVSEWDAVTKNEEQSPFINADVTTEYIYRTHGDKVYAIETGSNGITKREVKDGVLGNTIMIDESATSATVLTVIEEDGHDNLYYSVTGGKGYTVNRIAIDGEESDYRKPDWAEKEPDKTFKSVKALNLDASSSWFMPEFVGNKLFFASETDGMSSYNYIMVCDLEGKDGKKMTNNEISALQEKYKDIFEKIDDYDDEENPDGSKAYEGLSDALKYVFYTGDSDYINELIRAYVDIQGKDEEYLYSKETLKIYDEFVKAEGDDWSECKEQTKTVNGKTVYTNSIEYYYNIVGRMTDGDAKGYKDYFRSEYMDEYPVDNSTWWEGLSTGAKAGFIIGMVACGLIVIGGVTVLVIFLVKRRKNAGDEVGEKNIKVDITDDKSVDVYGNDEAGESTENGQE